VTRDQQIGRGACGSPEGTREQADAWRPRQNVAGARPDKTQVPRGVVKFPVEKGDVCGIGRTPASEPTKDPINRLPQRARPGEHPGRFDRTPSDLASHRLCLGRRQYAALPGPLDQTSVPLEPFDRPSAPTPAHRVGEVQARVARQMKLPSRRHSDFSLTAYSTCASCLGILTILDEIDSKTSNRPGWRTEPLTRDWCAIALLMLSLLAGWSDPAGAQLQAQTIRIGIGAPLTGGTASFGIEMKNAVELALDEQNAAGGLLGARVDEGA
jgi:hypothetical protein